MRTAMSHIDLGIIRARRGDLDQAVHHGLTAFSYDRKTEASLLSHAADLDQLLRDRYGDERLADDFHQRYRDAQISLRRKEQSVR
jgi:hypothetical protein